MKRTPKHPMQPLILDDGVVRFKANAICRFLLDSGRANLNDIAAMPFADEDREQFAQLIGYSLIGYGELGYVSARGWAEASEAAERLKNPPRRRAVSK